MNARTLTKETILQVGLTDKKFPTFRVGDTIEVAQIIKELEKKSEKKGEKPVEKERIQLFTGDVIGLHNNGISSTFTIRRIGANGVGVERIFPFHAPSLSAIRVVKVGMARRAKLYYLRERVGKAARIKEKILTKEQKVSAGS